MILSLDTTHLLMASEDSDVVGMKAVPQTPQGLRRLTCVFYEQSAKYSSSAADTLELYRLYPPRGGRKDWPGFLNSTGRLKAQNNAPSKMPGAHPVR